MVAGQGRGTADDGEAESARGAKPEGGPAAEFGRERTRFDADGDGRVGVELLVEAAQQREHERYRLGVEREVDAQPAHGPRRAGGNECQRARRGAVVTASPPLPSGKAPQQVCRQPECIQLWEIGAEGAMQRRGNRDEMPLRQRAAAPANEPGRRASLPEHPAGGSCGKIRAERRELRGERRGKPGAGGQGAKRFLETAPPLMFLLLSFITSRSRRLRFETAVVGLPVLLAELPFFALMAAPVGGESPCNMRQRRATR